MILIDTSVWIASFRDRQGRVAGLIKEARGTGQVLFTRHIQLELLQGCTDEDDWARLNKYLSEQTYLEMRKDGWIDAARIFFDLQRMGSTVRSAADCCIAQLALDHDVTLLHSDRDFEKIATVRPLKQQRLAGLEPFVHG